jgi:hypothetical protein
MVVQQLASRFVSDAHRALTARRVPPEDGIGGLARPPLVLASWEAGRPVE